MLGCITCPSKVTYSSILKIDISNSRAVIQYVECAYTTFSFRAMQVRYTEYGVSDRDCDSRLEV